jgi:hypothetical protein
MVYGEVDDSGQLNVVAVLHDDTILRIDTPVYFSPELVTVGPTRSMTRSCAVADLAGLIAIAITTDPAGHGLSPVRIRPGDVRSSAARSSWPLSWKSDDALLERCVQELGDHPRVGMLVRHRPPEHELGGWVDYDGRPMRTPPGGTWLRHGQPGRILRVG